MHMLRTISRRNNTRDTIVDLLRAEIGNRPDVVVREVNQTTIFGLLGRYEMKFKKADECGDVELSDCQASWDFHRQHGPSMLGDDFPPLTNVYLSSVDTANPREVTPFIICPNADGIEWMHEIDRPADEAVIEITPPITPPDDGGDDLVRVIPKPDESTSEQ
jgi:hypothetical protein